MKLVWRPMALGENGPAIDTSLTSAEIDELCRLAKGADVLEIGSAYGYSAAAMALAGGHVDAVDPHAWLNSFDAMANNLAAYQVSDRVKIHRTDSWTALPDFAAQGRSFDLVWVDGDHEAVTVSHDIEWARRLLRPNGTLACHDYGEDTCPGVRQALDAWKAPPRLVDTLAVYGPGEW